VNDHEMTEFIATRKGKKKVFNVKMVNFNNVGVNKHQKKR